MHLIKNNLGNNAFIFICRPSFNIAVGEASIKTLTGFVQQTTLLVVVGASGIKSAAVLPPHA
ncbi:MAG: hypothetical protein H7320_20480 [Ferruginibacter sp.]|nr:hypothetical protein [Ferruginibacter sp.]